MSRTGDLAVRVLLPALSSTTSSASPVGVDLQGEINPGGRSLLALINFGTVSATAVSVAFKIQDSDTATNATDFADVSGAVVTVTSVVATYATIPFHTNKRYVRLVQTWGTQMTSAVYGAELIGVQRFV